MIFHFCFVAVIAHYPLLEVHLLHMNRRKKVCLYTDNGRHDSSAHISVCIANMWIQKIGSTWYSGINIKVCPLLVLILTHHSLSLCTQNQRCDPGLVFPRSLPVGAQWFCTTRSPGFGSAKLKSSNSSTPRMDQFWPLNHFWDLRWLLRLFYLTEKWKKTKRAARKKAALFYLPALRR